MATDWKLPWDGGCRCGKIRFRVTQPPLLAMACHCTGCQSMSASAFSLSIAVPATALEVTQGEPVVGGLHGPISHFHCDWCKSWIFTRLPPEIGPIVNVRVTTLDAHHWFAPYIDTCASEKLAWAETGATHSFDGFPDANAYPALIAEYQEKGAKP